MRSEQCDHECDADKDLTECLRPDARLREQGGEHEAHRDGHKREKNAQEDREHYQHDNDLSDAVPVHRSRAESSTHSARVGASTLASFVPPNVQLQRRQPSNARLAVRCKLLLAAGTWRL